MHVLSRTLRACRSPETFGASASACDDMFQNLAGDGGFRWRIAVGISDTGSRTPCVMLVYNRYATI
jgi:hypothetical protein